jgi:membrane protein required for colicin V production
MEHWSLGALTLIDIAMIVVLLLSMAIGMVRGFAKESISLLTWIVASVVSVVYFQKVGDAYLGGIQLLMLRYLLSALLLSLSILVLGGIISYLISALIQKTGFGLADRMIGAVFGGARGLLLLVIGVLITLGFPKLQTPSWHASAIIPLLIPSATWLKERVHIPESLKNILESTPSTFGLPTSASSTPTPAATPQKTP